MLVTIWLVVFAIFLAVRLYKNAFERPPNFPPGLPKIPIWGSYWFLLLNNYQRLHKSLVNFSKFYKTKTMGFYIGPFPTVVTSTYDALRDVLFKKVYMGRPEILLVRARAFGQRLGIFFSDGEEWTEQKRFLLRNLRDMGFGRRFPSAEQALADEVTELLGLLNNEWTDEAVQKDGCVCFPMALHPPFVNMVWSMMTSQRFSKGDYHKLRDLTKAARNFVSSTDVVGGAVTMAPWLMHINAEATRIPRIVRANDVLADAIKEAHDEHVKTFSEHHLRDFLDRYIMELQKEPGAKHDSFTLQQLQIVGADVLIASATTTTTTLTFTFTLMMHNPEVQRRCQEEIDRVVGRDRLPTLDDRPNMPYVEATLRESMRRHTMLPLAIPHFTIDDTLLDGYDLPKNTVVLANLYGYHMDPDVWGDPEKFRPERFLDADGKLVKDVTMPFGGGKRLCPGETFSRMSMFVVLSALLQNYTFVPADFVPLPAEDSETPGIATTPHDLWLRPIPR